MHKTVNHSVEFLNDEGFHTNKKEGHRRQMKAALQERTLFVVLSGIYLVLRTPRRRLF